MKKVVSLLVFLCVLSLSAFAIDYNGYIVKIKENTLENLAETSFFSDRAMLFSDRGDSEIVELLDDEFDDVTEINSDHLLLKAADEAALDKLIELGVVDFYEENIYAELYGYDFSANPSYESQKWYLDAINARFAWNAGIFGSDTRVAVIDSGVYAHNDIKNNLIPGRNYVAGEELDDTADNHGHGTAVAGLIAAQCNSIGTVGVSFRTKIVPLKVTNNSTGVEIAGIIEAIFDAVDDYDCDVINMSLGVSSDITNLKNAVTYAINNGVIVVAAAGNDGDTGYRYPASYDGVISVANAETYNGGYKIFSSSQKNDKVDIAAPGTQVITLANNSSDTKLWTGTSFSAPVVSAIAALVKSVDEETDSYEFEHLIKLTADDSYISTSGQNSNAWGEGMVDVESLFKTFISNKLYVSKKLISDDNSSVYITNFTDADIEDGTLIVSEYDEYGTLISVTETLLSLKSYESKEFSFTDNGFSQYAKARYIGNRILGDVNADGTPNIRDASVVLRYNAGYDVGIDEKYLDVNGDGDINIKDASAVLRIVAGYDL